LRAARSLQNAERSGGSVPFTRCVLSAVQPLMIHRPMIGGTLAARPGHPKSQTHQLESAQRRAVPGEAEPARRASPLTGLGPGPTIPPAAGKSVIPAPAPAPARRPGWTSRTDSPRPGKGLVVGLGRLTCRSTTAFERERASPFAVDLKYGWPVDANRLAERAGARRLGALVVRERACWARPFRLQNAGRSGGRERFIWREFSCCTRPVQPVGGSRRRS
jgi:hypothetical protein